MPGRTGRTGVQKEGRNRFDGFSIGVIIICCCTSVGARLRYELQARKEVCRGVSIEALGWAQSYLSQEDDELAQQDGCDPIIFFVAF